MRFRYVVVGVMTTAVTVAILAQDSSSYKAARLPDGTPDLQGTWDLSTATPLQRPAAYGTKQFLDDEELRKLTEDAEERVATRNDPNAPTETAEPGEIGAHDAVWLESSTRFTGRTSLIVDPPDGRIPPLTEAARKVRAARAAKASAQLESGLYDSWEDLPPRTRCISRPLPRESAPYNNGVQIVQAPGQVVLYYEFFHEARIIPTDGRPQLPPNIRRWLGDSRGRWEGDTLVVETTNITDKQEYQGMGQGSTRLTERYTRIADDTLRYVVTIGDPTIWTRPWTFEVPWARVPADYIMFEYACHEGNIQMATILKGARAKEREGVTR